MTLLTAYVFKVTHHRDQLIGTYVSYFTTYQLSVTTPQDDHKSLSAAGTCLPC